MNIVNKAGEYFSNGIDNVRRKYGIKITAQMTDRVFEEFMEFRNSKKVLADNLMAQLEAEREISKEWRMKVDKLCRLLCAAINLDDRDQVIFVKNRAALDELYEEVIEYYA